MGVVSSVVEALGEIVAGRIDPAKQKIEDVLAALIPVAIGLFARLVRLGGLGRKVQEFIEAIRGRIERAVRRLILKIKARVQRMMRRRRSRRGERDAQNAHQETSPEDERTHRRFAGEAKAALEAPPAQSGDVIDFAAMLRQKRAEADRLEQRYDRRLENPVRMTIAVDQSEAVRVRQIIPFEVRVAPNDTVMDGVVGSVAMVVNLLMHLREVEHTAQTIDPGLEAGLSAAAAPAPSTRLPETLDNVFVARTTLKPVFDERSTVGRQLVSELVKIHVVRKVGDLEIGKRFKDGGQKTPFYTMLRTDISAGLLDQRVRHPVLLHEVLEKTMPGIPSGARDALEGWLEEAAFEELPDEVRASILGVIQNALLESEVHGSETHIVIGQNSANKIRRILDDAKTMSKNPASLERWKELLFQPEWHHAWPKEYAGQFDQPALYLPRILHNFAGTHMMEGGFHQRLNARIRNDSIFQDFELVGLVSRQAYMEAMKNLAPGDREKVHSRMYFHLVNIYHNFLQNPHVAFFFKNAVGKEYQRLMK